METVFSYLNGSTIGLIAMLLLSYFVLKNGRARRKLREPPEASGGWPIIGHLRLLGSTGGSQLPHITLGAMADKYGPVFKIRLGVHPCLVISSWEVAKQCYTTFDSAISSRPKIIAAKGPKFLGYDYASFGFRAYDSFYRSIRKILASELLSNRRLELQKHIRVSEVKRAVTELYDKTVNNNNNNNNNNEFVVVDLDQWLGNINLNCILMMVCGKRFFGKSTDDDEKEVKRCREAMKKLFDLMGKLTLGDAIPFLRWLDFGGFEKAMKKTGEELDSLVSEWLKEHHQKRKIKDSSADDFMDVMISNLQEIDLHGYDADTVNKATCMSIISGGTDTTTVTLSWALSLLLNNREALKKAQEEIEIHVGNKRQIEESDISKLEYLQAIVKESLRLYPAGPLSGSREFSQDCVIGGYDVAAGTRLITNLWKIQTDPRVWPEPLEFKPERFLGISHSRDVDVKGGNFELIPFGGGRRACPGMGFGIQMTQLVLASLIHAFELKTRLNEPVDMAAEFGLTIHRATPLYVLVKPRLLPSAYGCQVAS